MLNNPAGFVVSLPSTTCGLNRPAFVSLCFSVRRPTLLELPMHRGVCTAAHQPHATSHMLLETPVRHAMRQDLIRATFAGLLRLVRRVGEPQQQGHSKQTHDCEDSHGHGAVHRRDTLVQHSTNLHRRARGSGQQDRLRRACRRDVRLQVLAGVSCVLELTSWQAARLACCAAMHYTPCTSSAVWVRCTMSKLVAD